MTAPSGSDERGDARQVGYLQRYLIEELVEEYQEAQLSRREMVRRVLLITGSVPATASILLALGCGAGPATSTLAPVQTPATRTTVAGTTARATAVAATTTRTAATTVAATTRATTAAGTTTATRTTAATTTRAAASPSATPNPVTVSPTDPAIEAGPVEFPGQGVTLKGYKSQPRGAARAPGIVVIHENRGLTEHIKDMTRRYARDGYLAVAVDLVSRRGGTDGITDPGQIMSALGQGANRDELAQDLLSTVAYLKGLPNVAGPQVGVVGYCFGGGMTWLLATRSPDVAAAIPYYGPPPEPIDEVRNIAGAVLAFYGDTDRRITDSLPRAEAAMRQYGKTFEYRNYPDVGHAFNNDTGQNYNAAAARDAYQLSLDWFARYLGG